MRHSLLWFVLAWSLLGCPGEFDPDLGDLDLDFDGEQPDRGLYSACTEDEDCVTDPPRADACMVVDGLGFCTRLREGDEDPEVYCAPHPGGDVTAELDFVLDSCVLDCDDGRSCPVGMECRYLHASVSAYLCI